jgi:RNA polymerase sigma-70 factor (ECF subfamily)
MTNDAFFIIPSRLRVAGIKRLPANPSCACQQTKIRLVCENSQPAMRQGLIVAAGTARKFRAAMNQLCGHCDQPDIWGRDIQAPMRDGGEDVDLLRRAALGEQAAAARLFERHQIRVFRFVTRLVLIEAVAEEVTNEVFLEVWRRAKTYENRSAPLTWILAIAYNKAVSVRRRKGEERLDEEQAYELADDAPDPEMALLVVDKSAALRRCLAALSVDHRTIIDLVYTQELSVAEAAQVVGIPEGTVKTRLFHARKRLSRLLLDAGVDRGWP